MNARLLVLFAAGVMFGAGLAVSGMTDPARVIGFLDVTGRWDASLAFVMAGAVGTYGIGIAAWRKRTGGKGWFGSELPSRDSKPVDRHLALGAVVFGIGWGMGGFCPGPALGNLGALRIEALVFVPAMMVGMLLAQLCFAVDRD